jgi:hypothetical protein
MKKKTRKTSVDKRLAEITAFKNTDFSDTPELTDEQLKQLKPSHYRNMHKPVKKTVNARLALKSPKKQEIGVFSSPCEKILRYLLKILLNLVKQRGIIYLIYLNTLVIFEGG